MTTRTKFSSLFSFRPVWGATGSQGASPVSAENSIPPFVEDIIRDAKTVVPEIIVEENLSQKSNNSDHSAPRWHPEIGPSQFHDIDEELEEIPIVKTQKKKKVEHKNIKKPKRNAKKTLIVEDIDMEEKLTQIGEDIEEFDDNYESQVQSEQHSLEYTPQKPPSLQISPIRPKSYEPREDIILQEDITEFDDDDEVQTMSTAPSEPGSTISDLQLDVEMMSPRKSDVAATGDQDWNMSWLENIRISTPIKRKLDLNSSDLVVKGYYQKNSGVLVTKFKNTINRLKTDGATNMANDSEYLDVVIVAHANMEPYYSTICKDSKNDAFIDVIFTSNQKKTLNLTQGSQLRLFSPFTEYFQFERRLISCPYFCALVSLELADVTEDFEALMDSSTTNQVGMTQTQSIVRSVISRVGTSKSVDFPSVVNRISTNPLCDQNFESINMTGIIQRVFRRKEQVGEMEMENHIDFIEWKHLAIISERETKRICLLYMPFGEREYFKPILNGQGHMMKFTAIRLTKVSYIGKKSPLYSFIRELSLNFHVFEFGVQMDTTLTLLEDHQQPLEESQTDTQLDYIQKSIQYIPLPIHTITTLDKLADNVRFDIEGYLYHIAYFSDENPLCILYIRDPSCSKM